MNFIENESAQKLRGGYYTPLDLATFISQWVCEISPKSILEPSCGDGVFVEALANINHPNPASITGFELLPAEAVKARQRAKKFQHPKCSISPTDFLNFAIDGMLQGKSTFDAVVGNPPFIRYQYLPAESQKKAAAIFEILRLPFTKHTNAWVPFVLGAAALLRPGGRLGMVLPSEIIHVMHSQSLRTYLGTECSRLLVIDPEELWFDQTLQGAVILLAEKKANKAAHSEGVGIVRVSGRAFTKNHPSQLFNKTLRINGKTVEGKWTRALLTASELALFDSVCNRPEVSQFDTVASVDVGIVTGANKFFLVDDKTVTGFGLKKYAHPMFGRSEHCPGVIYDENQHEYNAAVGIPTNFLWIKEARSALSEPVKKYISSGEKENLHKRYKCRIRSPWYTVPSVYASEVCMLKRSSDTPRLILNRLSALTTDTAYRIRTMGPSPEKLVYCFLNALTALSAELEGRHYGGGVLELVPSEIEKLMIPLSSTVRPALARLDEVVRKESVNSVLEVQGKVILGAMGVSHSQQEHLLGAWLRLKNRRQRISEN